jgi:predicted transcriptional regulator/uncharacterized membrane protein
MKLNITVLKPNFDLDLESGWGGVPEPIKTITILTDDVTKFTLNFTVYNLNKETWVDFKVIVPKDWMSTTPTPIFMPSFSNTSGSNLSLTVFPSSDREYSPTQEELPIILEAYSRRYIFAADSVTFKVKIAFIPFPEITPPGPITAKPGEFYININITNDGNGQDAFTCEASVGQTQSEKDSLNAKGWKAEVFSGKYSKILNPGENHTVIVKITIPSTEPAGAPCLINITVTSEKAMFACPDHPYAFQSTFGYVYSGKYHDVDIQDNISSLSMLPDNEQTISFSIRNTGNGIDNSITVNVTSAPEDWIIIVDTDDIPFTGLGRQAEADIELTIKTPKEAIRGRYSITVAGISNAEIKDVTTLDVDIISSHGIKLKSNFDHMNLIPGQDNTFNLTIENQGNHITTFDLDHLCLPEGSGLEKYIKLDYTSILLGPYMELELVFTINVPTNFSIDSNLESYNIEDYSLQINIRDQNETDNTDSLIFDLQINEKYDFKLAADIMTGYIVRNSNVGTSFNVNFFNLGNFQDELRFNAMNINGSDLNWLILPYKSSLPYNSVINLTIDIDPIAVGTPLGNYEFMINCSSNYDKSIFKHLKLILKVIDFDLKISEVVIDGRTPKFLKVLSGTKLKFSFDLSYEFTEFDPEGHPIPEHLDLRNLPVLIQIYDNDEEVINGSIQVSFISDITEQKISLYWTANTTGMHKINIIVDPENNIPENSEGNNIREISVQVNNPSISTEESGNGHGIVLTTESGMITLSALILIILSAFVGGTEVGKFNFLVGLLPLYTRLKRDKILDHETRGMIRGYIIANPGVHFNFLKRELKLKNGSLAYHLKVLERSEFIKIEREGMYTRLYPMKNGAYYKGAFNGVRLSELQKMIVRQIRIKPGITQKKIIERTNIKQQTVSRNISALEEKEVIKVKRKGRETYCYFNKEIELKDN